jgi:GNAT superfamily N-acetyltransferase
MIIRDGRQSDLEILERHAPSPGRSRFHEARFRRQRSGQSTLLVAYVDDVPVGSAEIRWNGCAAPEVAARFPDCPEVNGLTVWPPERRSRGVGTAIIRVAEARVAHRGHRLIGLGVGDGNDRAAALYLRLGYRETGCHYRDRYHFVDDAGIRHEVADPCRFLVKEIPCDHDFPDD